MAPSREDLPFSQEDVDAVVRHVLNSDNPQLALARLTDRLGPATPAFSAPRITLPPAPATPLLLTVRLDLVGARPPIWRRLEIRGDLTLEQVHTAIQAAMGWADCHLHHFSGPGKYAWERPYFLTDWDVEEGEEGLHEREARLDQVLRRPKDQLFYVYDFGDGWEHRLKVERVRDATDDDPSVWCLTARLEAPPEDFGGIHQWNEDGADVADDVDLDEVNEALTYGFAAPGLADRAPWAAPPPPLEAPTGVRPEIDDLLRRCPPEEGAELVDLCERAAQLSPADDTSIHEVLLPWRVLLETAGDDGIPLTKAGWMLPAACETLWHEGGLAWSYGKGNREQHTPELAMLRDEGTRLRLIRKHKDRLVLTPTGRRCRGDDAALAEIVVQGVLAGADSPDRDQRLLHALFIAGGWTTDERPAQFAMGRRIDWIVRVLAPTAGAGRARSDGMHLAGTAYALLTLLTAHLQEPTRAREVPSAPGARELMRRVVTLDGWRPPSSPTVLT